jgi:saccharopine dehydrogenase-like NADP-dependent oxidoreductase
MKHLVVLGAGMVGSAMAIDLASTHQVTITDFNEEALQRAKNRCGDLQTRILDVTDRDDLVSVVKPADLVINAVPGFLGYETLKTLIETGKNVVDIAFFPEDALTLDDLAKQHGVTAVMDCGVAPGMDNIILGHYNSKMTLTDFECLVGGLPKVKKWPFAYKAPFSPVDVIEEYTRPARYVENGNEIVRDALTDCEYVEFEEVGTLESFNSDGLRSIIKTMPHIPNMKEKTLRYPGHVEYVKVLKESGFFGEDEIEVNGKPVKPLDFTSKVLFKEWKLGEEEPEFTVMRVSLKGTDKNGKHTEVIYDLYDEYDPKTRTSSMARTTGYTATAVANWILEGNFTKNGVFPPELIGGEEGCLEYVLGYLKERGVVYHKRG